MHELFPPPPPVLPTALRNLDLLHAFLLYITAYFIAGIVLRLRFYWAVYDIGEHVRVRCPHIYALIHRHFWLCFKDGMLQRIGFYGLLVGLYMAANRWVWPKAHVGVENLVGLHPLAFVAMAVLIGVMLGIDLLLLCQVSFVDAERIKADLTWSEQWLGGQIGTLLGYLGTWNPLRRYADSVTRENFLWLHRIFRENVAYMTIQVAVRMAVAAVLFSTHLLL